MAILQSTSITGSLVVSGSTVQFTDNVGIGISSPSNPLDVEGKIGVQRVGVPGTIATRELTGTGHIFIAPNGYHPLIINEGSSEYLRVTNTGNVGIGTTSPGAKLDIKGTVGLQATNSTNKWLAYTYTDNTLRLNYNGAGNDEVAIDSSGNVGIGTTSPADKLQVQGNVAVPSGVIYNGAASNSAGLGLSNAYFDASGYYGIRFFSSLATVGSQTERMRITNTGNVGIGTTSPVTGLDVRTSTYSNTTARFGETRPVYIINDEPIIGFNMYYNNGWAAGSTGYSGYIGVKPSNGDMYFRLSTQSNAANAAVTDTTPLYIQNNGNVGIGTTSPEYILDIGAENTDNPTDFIRLNTTNGNSDGTSNTLGTGLIWKPHYNTYTKRSAGVVQVGEGNFFRSGLAFYTNNSADKTTDWQERMRIDKDGNVGIGTTSPSSKLEVAGVVKTIGGTANGKYSQIYVNDSYAYYTTNASIIYMNTELQVNTGRIGSYDEDLSLETSGTTRITVNNSSGNVGIGTTSPAVPLHVVGNIYSTTRVQGGSTTIGSTAISSTNFASIGSNSSTVGIAISRDGNPSTYPDLIINSSGNVGIGTSSPSEKLEVNGTIASIAASDPTIKVQGSDVNYQGRMRWNTAGNYLEFLTRYAGTYYTNTLVLDRGNVGIGTTSPSAKLHVDGDAIITGKVTAQEFHTEFVSASIVYSSGSTKFGDTSDDVHEFSGSLRVSGSGDHYFSDGNVGIGTTSPGAQLHIVNSGNGATSTIKLEDNAREMFLGRDQIKVTDLDGTTSQNLYIQPSGNTAFATTSGNVGIGTTSPGLKLDVNGDIRGYGSIRVNAAATGNPYFALYQDNNEKAYLQYEDSGDLLAIQSDGGHRFLSGGSTERMRIDSSGNVGIGTTSPWTSLVFGSDPQSGTPNAGVALAFEGTNYAEYGYRFKANGANYYQVLYNGSAINWKNYSSFVYTTRMSLTNGGNLGIGTTSPSYKLHVEGNSYINATSNSANLTLGRYSGQPTIKAGSDDSGYLIMDSTGGRAALNWYTSDHVILANGGGNVGIGTTTPDSKLHLQSASATGAIINLETTHTSGIPIFNLKGAHSAQVRYQDENGNNQSRIDFTDSGSFNFIDATSSTSHMYISTAGNVGIGTSDPDNQGYSFAEDLVILGGASASDGVGITLRGNGKRYGVIAFGDNADDNVGEIFYDHTDNSMNFRTNTSTQMRIASSGNVGIGTLSPTSRLEIRGEAATHQLISINRAASDVAALYLGNDSNNNAVIAVNNGELRIGKDVSSTFTEYVRIDSSGDVGIGTTSPSMPLTVKANVSRNAIQIINGGPATEEGRLYWYASDASTIRAGIGGDENALRFFMGSSATERMRIDSSGNVGIGTTSPSTKLHLTDTSAGFQFTADTGTAGDGRLNIGHFSNGTFIGTYGDDSGAADVIRFGTHSGDERMRIASNGNVGIGTISPSPRLHVEIPTSSDGSRQEIQRWVNTGQNSVSLFAYGGSTDLIQIGAWNSEQNIAIVTEDLSSISATTVKGIYIKSGGNVGIGTTSPSTKLDVQGGSIKTSGIVSWNDGVGALSYGTGFVTVETNTATGLRLKTNGSDRLTIKSGGDVGIGTTSPSYKLHVEGDIGVGSNNAVTARYSTNETYKGTFRWAALQLGNNGSNRIIAGRTATGGVLDFYTNNTNDASDYTNTPDGTHVMRMAADGKVGIGTTSPNNKLEISDTGVGTGSTHLKISRGADSSAVQRIAGIKMGNTANNDGSNWIVQADSSLAYFDNANLNFIHNSAGTPSTRMTITSSGNLGIGTTAPSSKLHVEGATKVYSTIGDADNVRTGIAHYDNSAMGSHVGGQLVLGYKYDTGGTYTEGAILKMYKENGTSGQYGSGLKFQVRNHGANLSTKMILDPSGNLGIGTTTPGAKLTVVGSAISISNGWTGNHDILFVGGSPSSTGAANQTAARIRSTASAPGGAATGDLRFTVNSGDSLVDGMYISTTGNVGIGTTSPGQLLSIQSDGSYSDGAKIDLRHPNNNTTDVIAGIGFSNNTGEVAKIVAGTTNGNTNGYVSFFTDDNGTPGERVRITSSGSVGIGTSSPTAKLQVEGSGSTIFDVQGSQGQLFSVTDDLTGTLFSVNDISGIPILSVDSDDTVTMGTFGENTLVVTGSNVGIGTDSPGAKLHVTSADANTVFLLGNTGTGGVNWAMYSANNSSAQAQAGGDLLFRNASSNVLVLQNDGDVLIPSGDVGIGTASPTTRLTVYEPNGAGNGSAQEVARFANTASGATSGYLYIGASSGTDWLVGKNVLGTSGGADFQITTHTSSPALTINSSTLNVGIGTTSPAWKLVVEGAGSGTGLQDGLVQLRSTTAANHSGIIFINSGNTSSFNDLASIQAIIESGDAKGALRFITRNTDGANTDVAERMRIFASGNVGINYSNGVIHTYGSGVYGGKAVIKASSDNALALLNSSTGGSAQVALNFTNEFVANQYNYLARIVAEPTQAWTSDAATRDSNLNFFTTLNGVTTERMRIDSNGQAYFKSSTDYKVGLNDSAGTNQWWLKSYTNGDFSIHENGVGDKLTIQAGGNVGIGNTSPTEKLEVAGNAILDASNANLKIKAGVGGTKGDIQWTFNSDSTVYASAGIEYDNRGSDGFLIDSGYPITLDYASSYIRFSNNGSEKMRLDTSGNLGIGTTSPGSKLHVEGTSAGAGIVLRVKNTGANGAAQLDLVNDAQSWFVNTRTDDKFSIYNNTASTTALTIDTSNNVGIGTTSPSSLLHVGGTITGLNAFIVDETTTNISLFEGYDSNNDGILIGVNSGGDPYFAPIENNTKQFSQEFLWDTSADEWVFEDDVQFNKIIKIQPAGYYVLANADTTRNSHKWQVNGTTYWDLYINANGNLEWRDSNGTQTFDVQAPLSKASGTFKIKHPDPSKNKTHFLHHSFVESPTAGDNIYRWQVEVVNGTAVVELPDYYKYLNENDQVWVSPFKHFGQAYGEVNEEQTYLTITANADGLYNVLCIGTRKDEDAVNAWTGCERLQPEPDGDLLDRDEYKDYKTNNE